MTGFFSRLIDRSMGAAEVIKPLTSPILTPDIPSPFASHCESKEANEKSNPENQPVRDISIKGKNAPKTSEFQGPVTASDPSTSKQGLNIPEMDVKSVVTSKKTDSLTTTEKDKTVSNPEQITHAFNNLPLTEKGDESVITRDNHKKDGLLLPLRSEAMTSGLFSEKSIDQRIFTGSSGLEGSPASSPATVKVTIGRVEVRAINPPQSSVKQRVFQHTPKISLDDYLKSQSGGVK